MKRPTSEYVYEQNAHQPFLAASEIDRFVLKNEKEKKLFFSLLTQAPLSLSLLSLSLSSLSLSLSHIDSGGIFKCLANVEQTVQPTAVFKFRFLIIALCHCVSFFCLFLCTFLLSDFAYLHILFLSLRIFIFSVFACLFFFFFLLQIWERCRLQTIASNSE